MTLQWHHAYPYSRRVSGNIFFSKQKREVAEEDERKKTEKRKISFKKKRDPTSGNVHLHKNIVLYLRPINFHMRKDILHSLSKPPHVDEHMQVSIHVYLERKKSFFLFHYSTKSQEKGDDDTTRGDNLLLIFLLYGILMVIIIMLTTMIVHGGGCVWWWRCSYNNEAFYNFFSFLHLRLDDDGRSEYRAG